jgi:imidazolonepropionase-like amidohydrolase
MRAIGGAVALVCLSLAAVAQMSPDVRDYVKLDSPVIAITHARVIDGTGTSARNDQTILIRKGKIESVGAVNVPADAKVIDATGRSVMPGLIDMHGHMFYTAGNVYRADGSLAMGGITLNEMFYSYPRLYLAAGVTSVRTTGAIEPYTDLNLKKWIDRGMVPGPKMDVTSPYLEGEGTMFPQMH